MEGHTQNDNSASQEEREEAVVQATRCVCDIPSLGGYFVKAPIEQCFFSPEHFSQFVITYLLMLLLKSVSSIRLSLSSEQTRTLSSWYLAQSG